jgi:DNA ligase-1
MRYEFPRLYLKTDNNQIRFWEIKVVSTNSKASIYTKYGLKGGKIIEPSPQIIDKPVGKKTPYDRALNLASTKWQNRIQKGYSEKEPTIKLTNTRYNVNKAIMPMKAYSLSNHNVHFPAYVQPKLDGYRALLHKDKTGYHFLSNTQRPYPHLEHLKKELTKIKELNNPNIYLDGELYLEEDHVNILRGILSSQELDGEKKERVKNIKYYVFDMFDLNNLEMTYEERYKILAKIFKNKFTNIKLTPTTIVRNDKDIEKAFTKYVGQGYEGIIVRNKRGKYKLRGKSVDVLKSKNIQKNSFVIVGYKQAKGNNKGTVIWEIRCNNNPKKSFWAKPMGTRNERKMMFKEADKYIGKKVMVKYFEIDKEGCVTKNPVAFF